MATIPRAPGGGSASRRGLPSTGCSGFAFRLVPPRSVLPKPTQAQLASGEAKHNKCSASQTGARVPPPTLLPLKSPAPPYPVSAGRSCDRPPLPGWRQRRCRARHQRPACGKSYPREQSTRKRRRRKRRKMSVPAPHGEGCSQHLHLIPLPCRPGSCPRNPQPSIPPAPLSPEDVPGREQRDTQGQPQGQPVLQPAHTQRRGPPCPAPQGDRRGQDATDHIRATGTSLDDGGHWARGREAEMRLLGTGGRARCPQPHSPSTLSTCSRASSPTPLRARQV